NLTQVDALLEDAKALASAGVFSIVLEAMPAEVARLVTASVPVPTIGIGAGPHCDGQILVTHDLLGFGEATPARFVRRYAELRETIVKAAGSFAADVRSGGYPSLRESYPSPAELSDDLARRQGGPAPEPDPKPEKETA
ncbi:MAG TPA: 3-methyl-2-oxobutanoate hydroxymethyltransferase, partial [Candidatus Polarisedimenticolia bacterium]|nr:3-methyl-2-oxobutanoate hydroxymethyltransferase [Candidatus Polarisedimenticolia bacterium]